MPHIIANIQLGSMVVDTFIDRTYNDFKMDYLVKLTSNSLIYQMIGELADP